jgi:hypothetical protein
LEVYVASERWLLLQHLLHVEGGHFVPESPGQFAPELVVSLRRNLVVWFIRISNYTIVNNFIQQTTKIFQIQNSKIVKSWVYNISKNPKEIPKINWSIEFPFHLYNTRRWKY